ncbi:hypothetical protein FSC37_00030 [Piscinibacter aquaticus]|uniref:Uncharacterized protein n=1 Tax=Piscinibacter aquaticus TaxID=392597 RepID=A0A5C6TYC5_9BURK|nr:hypothetical protein FSC37_00030 [Piscinibacter aquaticus]
MHRCGACTVRPRQEPESLVSILGAVVRVRPQHLEVVVPRMSALPGLDLALNPGDGRLVLVLEDAEREGQCTAPLPRSRPSRCGPRCSTPRWSTSTRAPMRRLLDRARSRTTAPGAAA